jgi:hypothetical protein
MNITHLRTPEYGPATNADICAERGKLWRGYPARAGNLWLVVIYIDFLSTDAYFWFVLS